MPAAVRRQYRSDDSDDKSDDNGGDDADDGEGEEDIYSRSG